MNFWTKFWLCQIYNVTQNQPWHFFLNRFTKVASMSWMLPGAAFEARAWALSWVANPGAFEMWGGERAPRNECGQRWLHAHENYVVPRGSPRGRMTLLQMLHGLSSRWRVGLATESLTFLWQMTISSSRLTSAFDIVHCTFSHMVANNLENTDTKAERINEVLGDTNRSLVNWNQ